MASCNPLTVNPVIQGFAPDPTVTRIGDTFFLAVSSFHIFPGIPIFASKDLLTWQQIGNAINRPSQLSLRDSTVRVMPPDSPGEKQMLAAGGLYAPTIRHHSGVTYIVCTNVLHHKSGEYDLKNFIVSTTDVWSGEWSNPVYFDFFGIDPSLSWDENGRTYIHGSWWIDRPTLDRVNISCQEIDLKTGKIITPTKVVWEGFSREAPEGPHIYKKDGWYYLLIAEGGTGQGHHINMARARDLWGPFESCPHNPVLPVASHDRTIQHTGHADVFQDQRGQWWMVCLGVRKDQEGRFYMGRETFISKVNWPTGGWPTLEAPEITPSWAVSSSNFLPPRKHYLDFVYIRDPDLSTVAISPTDGRIRIIPSQNGFDRVSGPISFVGKCQRAIDGMSTARLLLPASLEGGYESGLALYKDEHRYVRIFWDCTLTAVTFEVCDHSSSFLQTSSSIEVSGTSEVLFKAKYSAERVEFSYATDLDGEYKPLGTVDTLDVSNYDFTGPVFGIFSFSENGGKIPHDFIDFQVDTLN